MDDSVHMLHISSVQRALRLELGRHVLDDGVQAGLVVPRRAGQGADGFLPDVEAGVFESEFDEFGDRADDE